MPEYHFVSIWQVQAPMKRVWEEIYHAERWPGWWKYVVGVDELEPGAADGVGKRRPRGRRGRFIRTVSPVGRVHCSGAAGSPPLVHRPGKERPGLCSDSTDAGPMRLLSGSPMTSSVLPS